MWAELNNHECAKLLCWERLEAVTSQNKPWLTIRFSHIFLIPNQIPEIEDEQQQQRLQQDVSMWCVLELYNLYLRWCSGKTNSIHWSLNAGFFGNLCRVVLPWQPKTHFFGDILYCSAADDFHKAEHSAVMGILLSFSRSRLQVRARPSGRSALRTRIRKFRRIWRHTRPYSKKTFRNLWQTGSLIFDQVNIFGTEILHQTYYLIF